MGGVAPVGRGRGGEAGEGGHGSASLPSIGPQPRQGARPAPGWGLLSGSGSAPAPQVPAAAGELRVHRAVTWKPAACSLHSRGHREASRVHTQVHLGSPNIHAQGHQGTLREPGTLVCAPTDHLTVAREHPRGSRPAALSRSEAPPPTLPSLGSLCAPSPHPRGRRGCGSGSAANLPAPLYLRQSPGRCRGRSSPAPPPRAAACCPGSTRSVGPGVLRGSSGGRVDRLLPLRRRLPKDAGGEGSALQALGSHRVWQEATACILHLSARRWESCVQG